MQLLQTVDPDVPITISAVKFDTHKPGIRAGAFVGNNLIHAKQREVVSSAIARTHALAGANADFFPWTCDPLGLTILDGRLVSEPPGNRPSIGFNAAGDPVIGDVKMALTIEMPDGRYVKADGVDRLAAQAEVIVYDRLWGPSTGVSKDAAELVLACDWPQLLKTGEADATVQSLTSPAADQRLPGDGVIVVATGPRVAELTSALGSQKTAKLKLTLQDGSGRSWLGVQNAVSGGSWLVQDGRIVDNSSAAGFGASFSRTRHPRTAVGITKNGSVLLLVVDGRQSVSRGASLKELAQIMLERGCVQAINLDGGGSSSLVVGDLVINTPSDGQQRQVASGLLVYGPPVTAEPLALTVTPATSQLSAGQTRAFQVATTDGQALTPSEMNSVVWGTKNGGGFVEQNGSFTGLYAGNHVVRARLAGPGSAGPRADATVAVLPAGNSSITLAWDPATPAGQMARTLHVTVKDAVGNVSPWAEAAITVTGGSANPAPVACGPDGLGETTVTWAAGSTPEARLVEVTSNGGAATIADQ